MHGFVSHLLRSRAVLLAVAALVFWPATESMAQFSGPGGGRGKTPPKKPDGGDDRAADTRPQGSDTGWIIKFQPPRDRDDEDLFGYLRLRPNDKDARTLKLRILRSEPPMVELGKRSDFEAEELPDLLARWLQCTVDWKVENPDSKRRIKDKMVTRVSFPSLDVEGTIEEIEDDMIVLRARPKNNQPWPGQKEDSPRRNPSQASQVKKVPLRKLKIKLIEDVPTFSDAKSSQLDLVDFEPSQTVEAGIVYGKRESILLSLKTMTIQNDDDTRASGGGGGRGRGDGR